LSCFASGAVGCLANLVAYSKTVCWSAATTEQTMAELEELGVFLFVTTILSATLVKPLSL
jgi:hypothetical protein